MSNAVRENNNLEKRSIKGLIQNHDRFIQDLRTVNNISTISGTGAQEGGASGASLDPSGTYLNKSGDFMVGPFGNDFIIVQIVDGLINASRKGPNPKPLIYLTPENGMPDDLDTIYVGDNSFPFQELWISTSNESITFTEAGNIQSVSGGLTVPPHTLLKLVYDFTIFKWILVSSSSSVGGGGGESNRIHQGDSSITVNDLGVSGTINFAVDGEEAASMTTAFGLLMSKDLNMGNNDINNMGDIYFNHPVQAITSRENGLNYAVNTGAAHDFFISTLLKVEIGNFVRLYTTLNLSNNNLLLNASSRIQGELIPDVAFRNFGGVEDFWGSMFGGKLFIKTIDVNIDALQKEMVFNVPDDWGYEWRINGVQAISIRKDGSLDISGEDLQRVHDLEFSTFGQKIQSRSNALIYEVPENDIHTFLVNSSTKLSISASDITMSADLQMSTNDIFIDGSTGVLNFSVNDGAVAIPSHVDHSIRVKIGGVVYRVPAIEL